ncbi:biosynthetic-type acetolactate synthase large subunit [Chromobacterium subtsugae]|uniref:Acetolactate synthase n=1 Tax=Chromobacterium subtsugae TaxID=251747 RepID=A0ABS7FE59_9NEIS|nr:MULTISPECIES: biosynthetic-type acetolactate synthase large subunit [Chromobacterium]KUM03868.1 acetolactate synthase 3 catalytic subunit [Chromobacterium subtsugae]KZE87471.1 acetolactate synthase 3 catalytic subunit [Chromobacterium sp. F49]MBW7566620.1 biosynthetic-type acetolactate synthase large subunit [Chromobacterium subtsugae]MBW8288307.1 biosynthetic-type acetolactate synthase large subunit [Chromobacterium subtsugae]WSE92202.1 biosynthetic-type acetolactate synthase large subunit
MQISGAEIVVRCLQEEGAEFVFGYPGGAVLEIYDAIFRQDKFKHVLVRHEQAAVHAADAYSRSSDKVGVALVTSGPGATNAVTGIATAYMDSIPMVVISGQVPSPAIGLDAFQEVDMVGITRPCVKHNFLIKDVNEIAATIKKAFYIAKSGRPGPVVVDIPKDITQQRAEFHYPESVHIRSYVPATRGHSGQIKKAVNLLLEAKRPFIYVGGGAVQGRAEAEVTELVRSLNLPCTNTLMGLGAYPGSDRQFLGMLGMHGTYEANMAMQHCDVLVAIGARFDDRVISVPSHFLGRPKKIIHIDVDPSSISKRVRADIPIVGDVKLVLKEMLEQLKQSGQKPDGSALNQWWKQIEEWRGHDCLLYTPSSELIKPQMVVQQLYEITGGQAIITSDVGQHQMWAAQYYKFDRPKQWLNSGGLGTMGFGLPAAIGAQLANPNAQVACITGEGSIQMNIQELSTAKQYHTPVKVVALNNRYLGMVRQWQEFFYGTRYSESYMDALPDFVKIAEAYGHVGFKVESPADVEPVLREAFSDKLKERLVFLDFRTDQSENVFPMIQNGKGLDEMDLPPHMRDIQQVPFENNRDYGNMC